MMHLLPYLDDTFEKKNRTWSLEETNETNMGQLPEQKKI